MWEQNQRDRIKEGSKEGSEDFLFFSRRGFKLTDLTARPSWSALKRCPATVSCCIGLPLSWLSGVVVGVRWG